MKESYRKGVAYHPDPEPCEGGREAVSEFGPHHQAEAVLLPLYRIGRLAAEQARGLRMPAGSPRHLYGVVWGEVIRLLEDPALLQAEITRRLEAAKQADPAQQRQQHLLREQARLGKSVERLLTAYQESLLSLDDLRKRIEPLRKQHGAVQSELQAIETAEADQQRYLSLVESLAPFQARLRTIGRGSTPMDADRPLWPPRREFCSRYRAAAAVTRGIPRERRAPLSG